MEKKKYITPAIEIITLDNEISLALASEPPFGPGELVVNSVDQFQNDPFKTIIV
jgi:hypothetical protein